MTIRAKRRIRRFRNDGRISTVLAILIGLGVALGIELLLAQPASVIEITAGSCTLTVS